jgi:hypothetical protein
MSSSIDVDAIQHPIAFAYVQALPHKIQVLKTWVSANEIASIVLRCKISREAPNGIKYPSHRIPTVRHGFISMKC